MAGETERSLRQKLGPKKLSCQQFSNYRRVPDAGQPLLQTMSSDREVLVFESEKVEYGRVQVVHMDGVFCDVVSSL